jgi:hypothetical protein
LVPNIDRKAGLAYPYSSGIANPNKPIAAACSRILAGIASVSSISSSAGTTTSRTKLRTMPRMSARSALSTPTSV